MGSDDLRLAIEDAVVQKDCTPHDAGLMWSYLLDKLVEMRAYDRAKDIAGRVQAFLMAEMHPGQRVRLLSSMWHYAQHLGDEDEAYFYLSLAVDESLRARKDPDWADSPHKLAARLKDHFWQVPSELAAAVS